MSNTAELPDPILDSSHHPHPWCDLSDRHEDEPQSGRCGTAHERLLGGYQDLCSGDATALNAALARALGQSVPVEVILSNVQDAAGGHRTAAQACALVAALLAGVEMTDGPGRSAVKIYRDGWDVTPAVCVDCDQGFHPDSSPHMDRCWVCAQRDDEESGR